MNRVVITNQAGANVVPAGRFGQITDMYLKAGGSASYIALYNNTTPVAADLLSVHALAANTSQAVTNMKVQFDDRGLYALVDANTEIFIMWGEWGGAKATPVLSGG